VNGEDRKLVVHAARNGFYYVLDRVSGAFVAGKQYVDELNWTTGLDPKTGRPLSYDAAKEVQAYVPGSHGSRAVPDGAKLCPAQYGGKNWEPSAYNPQLRLLYIPSYEGCNTVFTEEQKDMADQGGPVKPRERFAGGNNKNPTRLYGSLKAVDAATGEIKASRRLDYPNLSGALATAGNLVFIGEPDGTISAYNAQTLDEVWSFNTGTGINAPAVSYAVNGKQYIAILVGSKQPNAVMPKAPELKYTSTASMLYVFALD
jgi:alcohol dehydrogenase (cytochrome c)